MKRLIAWVLAAAMVLCACPSLAREDGETPVAENDRLALYLDEKFMTVSVEDKLLGRRFDTVEKEGAQGNKAVKSLQKSALNVTYITNEKNGTTGSMDSYSLSVEMKGASCASVENGVEITYALGDNTLIIDDLPKAIPASVYTERMKDAWTTKENKTFTDNYRVLSIAGTDGVTQEYFVRVKDQDLGTLLIKQLYKLIFEKGGVTEDDMAAYNAAVGYERAYLPKLSVTVRYTLSGGDFLVSVDCSKIAFTEENEVTSLELLPYFLTSGTQDEGYFTVPDGSGALIRFNNGKTGATSYSAKVYGQDALIGANTYLSDRDNVVFPMYGVKYSDCAVLAVIEGGAPLASIYADVSGRSDEFNRVCTRFTLREIERISLVGSDTLTVPRYSDDVFTGDLVMRYRFLSAENASYVGLAKAYQEYLVARGDLKRQAMDEDAPFYMELVGSVSKRKFFLGIPYLSTVQATTLTQAGEIFAAMTQSGVKNIHLLYSGLFTGGVKHASLTGANMDGALGSGRDWTGLLSQVRAAGGTIDACVYLERVYGKKNFSVYSQSARTQDGEPAEVTVFAEPILKKKATQVTGYYVSPHALADYAARTLRNLSRYDLDGLCALDLGGMLIPDYARGKHMNRASAQSVYEDALQKAAEAYGGALPLVRPNAYALRYASAALDLPGSDNGFMITDAAIPLNQLILEGCLPCCTESWNLREYGGVRNQLLYAIETRAAPRFTFTCADPDIFHNTSDMDFLAYFSTQYAEWLETAPALYAEFNAFYRQVYGASTVSHEILLSGGARKIVYDNGVTVYVNYGDADARIDGVTVPAGDYRVTREGGGV